MSTVLLQTRTSSTSCHLFVAWGLEKLKYWSKKSLLWYVLN